MLRLQTHVKAICLALAVLFEILVSLLPNGTVIDIVALHSPLACPVPPVVSLLFSFLLNELSLYVTQPEKAKDLGRKRKKESGQKEKKKEEEKETQGNLFFCSSLLLNQICCGFEAHARVSLYGMLRPCVKCACSPFVRGYMCVLEVLQKRRGGEQQKTSAVVSLPNSRFPPLIVCTIHHRPTLRS